MLSMFPSAARLLYTQVINQTHKTALPNAVGAAHPPIMSKMSSPPVSDTIQESSATQA